MADLVIRGMENIPVGQEFVIVENVDFERYLYNRKTGAAFHLVPLPEGHGRLIDADSFKADCIAATKDAKPDFVRHEDWLKSCVVTMSFCRDINERPTIVPAEGGTDNGN